MSDERVIMSGVNDDGAIVMLNVGADGNLPVVVGSGTGGNDELGLQETQQQGYLMAKACVLTAAAAASAANLELIAERLIITNATTTAGKYAWVKVNGTAAVPTAPAVGDGIAIPPGFTITVDVHSTPQAVVSGGGQISCIRGSDADCTLYVVALGNSAS